MNTEALPPVKDDPAVVKGRQVRQDFDQAVTKIRGDIRASDLAKAEQLAQAYEAASESIAALARDLWLRRKARYDELQQSLPTGPQIPEDATPADRAVLVEAFRSAIEHARTMSIASIPQAYAEAQRFGDEAMVNAIRTVVIEEGRGSLDAIGEGKSEHAAALAELRTLIDQEQGRTIDSGWTRQAFAPLPRPREVDQIAALQAAQRV